MVAFSSSTDFAGGPISSQSSSKITGFNGELRFKSSSDADEIRSSRTGSGGTMVGSLTGSGGAGGRVLAAVFGGGGGAALTTGGCFLPHPAATIAARATMNVVLATAVRIITHSITCKPDYLDQSG